MEALEKKLEVKREEEIKEIFEAQEVMNFFDSIKRLDRELRELVKEKN